MCVVFVGTVEGWDVGESLGLGMECARLGWKINGASVTADLKSEGI